MSEILSALNWVHQKLKSAIKELEEIVNEVDEREKERKIGVMKMKKNEEYEKLCQQLAKGEITFEEFDKKAKRISVIYGERM